MRELFFASALVAIAFMGTAHAGVVYSNGFETDTSDWDTVTRVASGTNGITSASGSSFHAIATSGDFTRWDGYNFGAGNAVATAFQEYYTSVDIFLNVSGGFGNDTRFDFSSAINTDAGTFLRDFVFNAGFYNDNSSPGSGTDRFVISASNNAGRANSYPENPGRDPFAISTTGWYTFEDHFYDNGGVLAVDMTIHDSSHPALHTWTLGGDSISGVGGNRYGWFVNNEFTAGLAIDNALMRTADAGVVPEAASIAVWGGLSACAMAVGFWRKKRAVKA